MCKPLSAAVFTRLLSAKLDDVRALPAEYLSECEQVSDVMAEDIASALEYSAALTRAAGFSPDSARLSAALQSLCAANSQLLNEVRSRLSFAHEPRLRVHAAPAAAVSADVRALNAPFQLMGERLAPVDVRTNHMAIYPAIELARGIAEALANKSAAAGLLAAHVDAAGAEELAADLAQLSRYAAKLAAAMPEIGGATAVLGDVEEDEE